ncbi:hypothetical protein Dimus_009333 [Dionaea muscipula]
MIVSSLVISRHIADWSSECPFNMDKKDKKKPAGREKDVVLVRVPPPLDPAFVKWLSRDIQRIDGFTLKNSCVIEPPDHYIEYMRLNGMLDLDLNDPDLAHLLKSLLGTRMDTNAQIDEASVVEGALISDSQKSTPVAAFSADDVQRTLSVFGDNKPLGIDCFNALFFKRASEIMGRTSLELS